MAALSNLITQAEKVSLGEDDIMAITMNQTRVVSYSDLAKCDNIMKLFHPYNNFVLFYETSSRSVGHWVCVLFHPNGGLRPPFHPPDVRDVGTIEFFDSYGMTDAMILGDAPTSDKLMRGVPYLTYLIQKSGMKYVYNNRCFQSKKESMATCGRYAALRSRFKDVNMYKFQSLLANNAYPSDFVVSALTVMFSPNAESLLL